MRSRIGALLATASVAASLSVVGASGPAVSQAAAASPEAPSGGCGTSTVAPGTQQIDFTFEGDDRFYVRRVPPAHDGTTPVPVVFDFHGLSEGSAIHQTHSQFGPHGDANGFVTIFPQARGTGLDVAWSTGITSVDVAMFGEMLDQLEADLCIDTNRVFVTGLSQGGFMTSAIACVYADRVAAIAPVAGLRNPTGCDPSRPIPVLNFHGTADSFVSYGPIPGIAAAWAARNDCLAGDPTVAHVGSDDTASVDHLAHRCPAHAPVQTYRVTGGGHSWPGSLFSRQIEVVVGYTTFVIDATALIWEFFAEHPMPAATGAITGRVLDEGNQSVAGASVAAYADTDVWVGTAVTTTDADGGYVLDVPPGEYRVLFDSPVGTNGIMEWWDDSATRASAPHVNVVAGATATGTDAALSTGGSVEGRVTGPDGNAVAGAAVWLYADTDLWVGTAATTTHADGTYTVEGAPAGLFRVMVRAPEGAGLEHQWWNGLPLSQRRNAAVLTVTSNQATADINVQLTASAPT